IKKLSRNYTTTQFWICAFDNKISHPTNETIIIMKSNKYILIQLLSLSFFIISCSQAQVKSNNEAGINNLKSDSFWKSKLSEEQYFILREKGTEKPYTGKW